MDENNREPMPKKSCMITLAFGIEADEEAMVIKKLLDEAIKEVEKKRFTFQIIEI